MVQGVDAIRGVLLNDSYIATPGLGETVSLANVSIVKRGIGIWQARLESCASLTFDSPTSNRLITNTRDSLGRGAALHVKDSRIRRYGFSEDSLICFMVASLRKIRASSI